MKQILLIDLDRCFGCHACEVACKQEKDLPVGPRPMQVVDLGSRRVLNTVCRDFVPIACFQCESPNCVEICPSGALLRNQKGIIQMNQDRCTGCALCLQACPYGSINLNPSSEKAVKCDFCNHLIEKGLEPSCVSHCPANALLLVEEKDFGKVGSRKYCARFGQVAYFSHNWKILPFQSTGLSVAPSPTGSHNFDQNFSSEIAADTLRRD